MSVEDWAEIRRLHRSEGMPIKAIARGMGVAAEYGAACVGRLRGRRSISGCGVGRRSTRWSRRSGSCCGLSADAGHGDRRAGRLGAWDHVFKDRVRELRPLFCRRIRGRARVSAGELAQCDLWFPPVDVPLGCRAVCGVRRCW